MVDEAVMNDNKHKRGLAVAGAALIHGTVVAVTVINYPEYTEHVFIITGILMSLTVTLIMRKFKLPDNDE